MPARQRIDRSVLVRCGEAAVWRRLTAPGGLDWLGTAVRLDLRPGGRGVVVDDRGARRCVQVLTVAPGLLRWRWQDDHGAGPVSEVALRLEAAAGGTRIVVEETVGEPTGVKA